MHQERIEIINKKKKELERLEKMKKGLIVGCDGKTCSIDKTNLEKKIEKKIDEKIDEKMNDAKNEKDKKPDDDKKK